MTYFRDLLYFLTISFKIILYNKYKRWTNWNKMELTFDIFFFVFFSRLFCVLHYNEYEDWSITRTRLTLGICSVFFFYIALYFIWKMSKLEAELQLERDWLSLFSVRHLFEVARLPTLWIISPKGRIIIRGGIKLTLDIFGVPSFGLRLTLCIISSNKVRRPNYKME